RNLGVERCCHPGVGSRGSIGLCVTAVFLKGQFPEVAVEVGRSRAEDPQQDAQRRSEKNQQRQGGPQREPRVFHDQAQHHRPPFLMSVPRRCRYAISATISRSASPGTPSRSSSAALSAASSRASSTAFRSSSSVYGAPSIRWTLILRGSVVRSSSSSSMKA